MAMKVEVRQPATYRWGLRDELIIPQIHGDKVQQKHYLTKLELLLKRLHAQFIDPARRGEDELVLWPSDHDFGELDVCVLALARALRKKKLLTYAGRLKL